FAPERSTGPVHEGSRCQQRARATDEQTQGERVRGSVRRSQVVEIPRIPRRTIERRATRWALGMATLFWLSSATAAFAQADPASAQTLFDQAKQLMADGKYRDACPKLEESQRLDPGPGTLFQLASCYEKIDRTATAWAAFLEVAAAAKAADRP